MSFKRFDQEDIVVSAESVTAPVWSGDQVSLTSFYTSSTQIGNNTGDFYYNVYQTSASLAEARVQFSIAYGHKNGAGSLNYNSAITGSPSQTIYGQYRSLVLGDENAEFNFGGASSEHFYALSVDRARYKEKLLPGTLDLVLTNGARDLNLTDLLFSYGIRINTTLIKDLYAAQIPVATGKVGNQTQFKNLEWFYHPLVNGNPNHAITKNVSPIRLQFANQIDTLKNNIKKTPLLISSVLTQKIGTPSFIELQSIADEVIENDYNNGNQLFAVLLEGNFKSAYKNRVKPYESSIYKENATNNKMVIISDGDVSKNQILKDEPFDLNRDKWTNQQFGNKDFLINSIDYLLDDVGLIQLRNKTLTIKTLDKQKAFKERTFWQLLNVVLPLLIIFSFGFVFNYWRKKKYS